MINALFTQLSELIGGLVSRRQLALVPVSANSRCQRAYAAISPNHAWGGFESTAVGFTGMKRVKTDAARRPWKST
jgi:hypothetical protein